MFVGETITIQTAAVVVDPFSGDADGEDWDNPTEVEVDDVLVAPGGSTENPEVAREPVVSDFDLIFQPPLATVPTAQDRVVVRGLVCEVVGRPFPWHWPTDGVEAGMVVRASIKER